MIYKCNIRLIISENNIMSIRDRNQGTSYIGANLNFCNHTNSANIWHPRRSEQQFKTFSCSVSPFFLLKSNFNNEIDKPLLSFKNPSKAKKLYEVRKFSCLPFREEVRSVNMLE